MDIIKTKEPINDVGDVNFSPPIQLSLSKNRLLRGGVPQMLLQAILGETSDELIKRVNNKINRQKVEGLGIGAVTTNQFTGD